MLLEFYGKECPHCFAIRPFLEKLEEEKGVKIERYEVWHNEKNAEFMAKYAKNRCDGVPFLFNTDTEDFICGEESYERIKEWANVNHK